MIENILKSFLRNLTYLSIIINLFFLHCKSTTPITENTNQLYNHPIFFIDNVEVSIRYIPLNHLIKNQDHISEDEWTLHAIMFFQQNEISYAEYCFIEAISQSLKNHTPYPLELNKTLKYYLNLLFFYEFLKKTFSNENYSEKRNESLKQYIELIQNREDLAILTIHEIRKRNFSKLEEDFVDQYNQLKENHTERFIYEYILTHLQNHKIHSRNLDYYFKIIHQISSKSLKESLIQQLGYYFYYKKDFESYIKIYEKNQDLVKLKINSSGNIFYIEFLFHAYANLYKKKLIPIPEDIYNNIILLKYVNENTYKIFLEYYYFEKFLFSKHLDYKKIKIYQNCDESSILFFTCPYMYTLKELMFQKEIFGTYDTDKLNQIKDFIINFN